MSANDAFRRPGLDGEASVDNARMGGETISKARLTAKPAGGAAALELSFDARGFAVAGRGTLSPGETTRLDLSAFSATKSGSRVALAKPAAIAFNGGDVDIRGLALAIGAGRLELDGKAGKRLDLVAKARGVPLSFAAIAAPGLALEGTVDADARIEGAPSAPAGEWSTRVAKLVAPQTRANGLPPVDIQANGKLAGGRTSLDGVVALGSASRLKVSGSAPVAGAGGLDLAIAGVLDAALANTALAANGQSLRGKANVDLRLSGAAEAPIASGNIVFSDGAFADPLNGIAFDRIAARLEASGRELNVASFSAAAKNGGQVGLTGHVTLAPGSGFPGAFHLTARNALLASTDVATSTADMDIDIAGALGGEPKISGRTTLLTMDVSVPDRLPASLKPIPGTTHIDAAGFAKQMLDLERKQREKDAKHAGKSKFDAQFDLAVSAPNRVFVRGRGIDAEFGGDLRLTGSINKPAVVGAFDLRRGTLQVATQRIDMTSGKLSFTGGLTPELDFVASTTAGDVTAKVAVGGPANAPVFAFTSSPELPQDEVMSRLLFAKASASLSPIQAVQLAAAVAQFTGVGGGVDTFEKMRRSLGVDSLDVQAGANGPTVGASRYISNNVSVGLKTGAKPEQSSVNVGVDVTKKLRVQGETSANGKTSVGVGVEWEY
jgi:translocation and assembly module TamB